MHVALPLSGRPAPYQTDNNYDARVRQSWEITNATRQSSSWGFHMSPIVAALDAAHGSGLLGLAAVLGFLSGFSAFSLWRRARANSGRARMLWLAAPATAILTGLW